VSNLNDSSTPEPKDENPVDQRKSGGANGVIPTGAQLNETRLVRWHQQGEALLTLENLRSWINAAGLVLYTPRPQIASPAPSMVEAVLGRPNATPTLAETEETRSLLARLVTDGLAVPLNLLGTTGGTPNETPDFIASTAVFSYVFTLRGDKTWKQPPETTGAVRVSPLALATFEALEKRGALSAYDLTTELGKEVTEAAVMRALGELWSRLRVLPAPQADGRPTLWELASDRFTKQIKAGANAGQPSALSALISLYLGQAVVASEEEIESFLSPLVARSRTRSVIHALMGARQLETIAIEGRTLLHVSGELPAFLGVETAKPDPETEIVEVEAAGDSAKDETGDAPRITKFVAKPKKIGTGYLAKASPMKSTGAKFGSKAPYKPSFGAKAGFKSSFAGKPAPDRERRPFSKGPGSSGGKFDKPWEEEKAKRLAAAARPSQPSEEVGDVAASASVEEFAPRPAKTFARRDADPRKAYASKPPFGSKPSFGSRPSFGSKPNFGNKPSFGSKPSFGEGRPSFRPRTDGDAPRKTFSKPGTFGRKREEAGNREDRGAGTFARRPSFSSEGRPPRRDFAPRAGAGDRGEGFAPRKPFGSKPGFSKPGFSKPGFSKPSFSKSDRPSFAGDRPARRPTGERPDRSEGTESGKRVYRKFDAPRDRPAKPFGAGRPGTGRPGTDRPARTGSFGAGSGDRPARKPYSKPAAGGGFGGGYAGKRPSGKPASGKKPFAKPGGSFASRPGSTFAKFADGNKPFGKRPPARKFKPKEDGAE
jgi:23S rRNA pseudouridine2605 synthase